LFLDDAGKIERLEGLFGEQAGVWDALRFQKATVGLKADLA
jgi:hypothetical protein